MNKKLFKAVSASLVLFLLGSCNFGFSGKETTPFDGIPDGELVTPYASTEVLRAARSASETDNDLVDWKVARFFAVVEKIGFESFYMWQGAKVSEKPVIIYYPESNKPRYYEFRVIKDGKEVGSITCNASKKEGDPVAYVSEMTHKVNASVARELVSMRGNLSLTAVNYPNSFVMRERDVSLESVNSEQIEYRNAKTNEVLGADNIFIPRRTEDFLSAADEKTLKDFGITVEEKQEMLSYIQEEKSYLTEFWNAVNYEQPEMLSMTDEEIEASFINNASLTPIKPQHVYDTETTTTHYRMLYDWYDKVDCGIPGGGWCAPYELSFIVLGLGEKSGMPEAKLGARAIYKAFASELGIVDSRKGPAGLLNARIIERVRNALRNRTKYTMDLNPTGWQRVENHLREKELPVLSLRIGGWIRYGSWSLHYRTIIGTAKTTVEEKRKFLWWKIRSTYKYYKWYYIHDNGSEYDDSRFGTYVDSPKGKGCWEIANYSYQTQTGMVRKYK